MEKYKIKKIEFVVKDNYTIAHIDNKILNNEDFIYVSNGCWYEKDSICWLEANLGEMGGLFVGNHIIDSPIEAKDRNVEVGHTVFLDGEMCMWEEFDIYDKGRTLLVKAELVTEEDQ